MNIDIKKLQNDLVLLKDDEPWRRLLTKHALWPSFEGGKVYRSTVSSIFSSVPLKFFSVFNSTFLERYTNFDMPLNVQNFQYILSVSIEKFEKKMFPEVDWSSLKVIMAKSEYFEDQERRPNIGINKLVSLFWSIPRIVWSIQYIRICNRMPLRPTDFIRFFFNSPVTFL